MRILPLRSFIMTLNLFAIGLLVVVLCRPANHRSHQVEVKFPTLAEKIGITEQTPGKAVNLADRNLFDPRRGVPVEHSDGNAGKSELATPPTPVDLTLTGLYRFGGEAGAVIVLPRQTAPVGGGIPLSPPRLFRVGDSLENGYCIQEIQPGQAVLSQGEQTLILTLRRKSEKKP